MCKAPVVSKLGTPVFYHLAFLRILLGGGNVTTEKVAERALIRGFWKKIY
jgi:hypothetical protein